MATREDRNGCALQGALELLEAVEGAVPILHASAGCGVGGRLAAQAAAGGLGGLSPGGAAVSSTLLQEKQVVFGGTSRLREQIKNTLKVEAGELYVVLSGCVPEIVGDDVPAMVKEAREQQFPVLGIAAPGFKGHAWAGYSLAARALLEQLPGLLSPAAADPAHSPDVNLLGLVPGHDVGWDGDLLELEAALGELGLRANRLVGLDQGLDAWRAAPRARASLVLSPWGLEPARALEAAHGVPVVELGWLPVGSRDLGLALARVGAELRLPPEQVVAAAERLDGRLRQLLLRAGPSLLLGGVQLRGAVVAPSAAAVGLARFLAGILGQELEAVILTDEPPEAVRAAQVEAVRQAAGPATRVEFLAGLAQIEAALRAAAPELVLGSGLEAPLARELGAAFVELAAPLRERTVLLRGHAGVGGAAALLEQLLPAVRRARRAPGPQALRPAAGGVDPRPHGRGARAVTPLRSPAQLHRR
ncbi:MAG: nitrogenase component 1 [Anaeromyxobacter sp.]